MEIYLSLTERLLKSNFKKYERTTAVLRNGGCSASFDSFVVGSSAVLRLTFVLKIRHYAKPRNVSGLARNMNTGHEVRISYLII